MSPLPCSPVSNSTASEQSTHPSEEDSDGSLTTPRPGPSDPAQRTAANLSQPSVPVQGLPVHIKHSIEQFRPSPPDQHSPARSPNNHTLPHNPSSSNPNSFPSPVYSSHDSSEEAPQLRERTRIAGFTSRSGPTKRAGSINWDKMPESSTSVARSSWSDNTKTRLQRRDDTESSADERTDMMRTTMKRAAPNANYGAMSNQESASNAQTQDYDTPMEDSSQMLRRKPSLVKANRASRSSTSKNVQSNDGPEANEGWLRSLIDKYGSVELENKGSVARDHLALERTFLAWLRTSLSFASIGIAVTQLFRLNSSLVQPPSDPSLASQHALASIDTARLRSVGKPLGATFLAISILILLIGFHRFFESQHYVIKGKFPASRGSIVLVSLVAAALIIASLVVILSIAPGAFEK